MEKFRPRTEAFSTVWKFFFHSVEKTGEIFPQYGKVFSTVWKTAAARAGADGIELAKGIGELA